MKNSRYLIAGLLLLAILILLGFFLPLGNYTTTQGCSDNAVSTKRLHVIFGDSIEEIKNGDIESPNPLVGCSKNTKYVLYFL